MVQAIKNIFKPKKIVLQDGREIQPPRSVVPYVVIGLAIAIAISAEVTGFKFSNISR